MLDDQLRGVRLEAARIAVGGDGRLPGVQQRSLDRAAEELLAAERFNLDREFGYLNMGNIRVLMDLQPTASRPGVLLVLTLERLGHLEEAGKLLDELKARHPNDSMVQSVRFSTPIDR